MSTFYIPITEMGLAEFLSSGLLGISASKASYQDMHTNAWPNTLVIKALDVLPEHIVCQINVKARPKPLNAAIDGRKVKLFALQRPIGLSDVQAVIFPSSDSLKEFQAKFGYMEDIGLDHIESKLTIRSDEQLATINASGSNLTVEDWSNENAELEKLQVTERVKLLVASYSALKAIIPVRKNIVVVPQNLEDACAFDATLNSVSSYVFGFTPDSKIKHLLDAYWSLCQSGEVSARSDSLQIIDLLRQKFLTGDEGEVASKFLQKMEDSFMGMAEPPQMDVFDPAKAFQHALYVAVSLNQLDSLDALQNRHRFSNEICDMARFLFLLRVKPTESESFNVWKYGQYSGGWQEVIIGDQSTFSISFSAEFKAASGVEPEYAITLNGREIDSFTKPLTPQEAVVVETLKQFNLRPYRSTDTGHLMASLFIESTEIAVGLSIDFTPHTQSKKQVHITASSPFKDSILGKALLRRQILSEIGGRGVSLGIDEKGCITLNRYQLADTMDTDELWHHVQTVAHAAIVLDRMVVGS